MLNKKILNQLIPIAWVIGISTLIIVSIAWLMSGGVKSSDKTIKTDTDKELAGPLAPDKLPAYNVEITNDMNPIATIKTNYGTIKLELFEDRMPITVGNFKKLAKEGFYDGTKFHRVIEGFMIQGGDPNSKTDNVLTYGTGGPGYTIQDEFIKSDLLSNVRGTIAMANTGQPNSGGSQFFINLVDNINLDFDKEPLSSKHPVFGRVVEGMDVVDKIGQVETNAADVPLEPVVVESITIEEKDK